MLQGMIKQRRESIALYEQGKRPELAEKERGEIAIIERFLPQQMGEAELEAAVKAMIAEIGAAGHEGHGPHHGGACASAHAGADRRRQGEPDREAAAELSATERGGLAHFRAARGRDTIRGRDDFVW